MTRISHIRRLGITVGSVLVVGSALIVPGTAMAGKGNSGTNISFTALSGEKNNVSVVAGVDQAGNGTASISDSGAAMTYGGNCAADGASLRCVSRYKKVIVNTRDADDVVKPNGPSDVAFNVSGGPGNDELHGSAGKDRLNGNSGNDTIYAGADGGAQDRVNCGSGADTAYVDIGVDTVSKNCEVVLQDPGQSVDSPSPGGSDNTGPTDPGPIVDPTPVDPSANTCTGVKALGKRAKVSKNKAKIKLSAPRSANGTCSGSLRLDTAIVRTGSKKVQKVKLGSAKFKIAPGGTATVKVKLSKRGAKVVKLFKTVRSRLTVYTDGADASASTFTSKTFTLKAKKARRR